MFTLLGVTDFNDVLQTLIAMISNASIIAQAMKKHIQTRPQLETAWQLRQSVGNRSPWKGSWND
jgi:hypothetical protein